jgi:RimJ/RimL family protein N-acetyltransferase
MCIRLRAITAEDFPPLLSWVTTYEELVQWSGPWNFEFPLDEQQLARFFLAEALEGGLQRRQFVAFDDDSATPIAQIGFSRIWPKTNAAHLGPVIVDPALRGMGIGQFATRELVRFGFEELKLHRIELVVFDFNKPAIACYEKVGFRTEGVLREIVQVGDTFWNWTAMSILAHEYAAATDRRSRPSQ